MVFTGFLFAVCSSRKHFKDLNLLRALPVIKASGNRKSCRLYILLGILIVVAVFGITYFSNHPEQLQTVSDLLKPADLLNMKFLGINLEQYPRGILVIISTAVQA